MTSTNNYEIGYFMLQVLFRIFINKNVLFTFESLKVELKISTPEQRPIIIIYHLVIRVFLKRFLINKNKTLLLIIDKEKEEKSI